MIAFRSVLAAGVLALALPSSGLAAGAGGEVTDVDFTFEGPFGTYDAFQLQRGFQVFQGVCAGCHGMQYVSFRELGREDGPAFPEEQVKAIAAQFECPDTSPEAFPGDLRACLPSDNFPVNNAVGAPDLSLMAKARAGFHGPYGLGLNQMFRGTGGAEYIYSLLVGYTGEESEVAGNILYENKVYPGGLISMAQPLWGDDVDYAVFGANGENGDGDHGGNGSSYAPPEATIEQQSKDVAAFLMWAAEPKMVERKEAGLRNLLMLIILAVLLYFTNKRIWAAVKGHD